MKDREIFKENLLIAQEKQKKESSFDRVNEILFEELERLNDVKVEDEIDAKVEIARGMALSNVSMTLLKSIGLQAQIEKPKYLTNKNA